MDAVGGPCPHDIVEVGEQKLNINNVARAGGQTEEVVAEFGAEAIEHFASLYPGKPREFLERQIGASLVLDEATGNLVFRFDPSIHQATGRGAIAEIPYLWESLEHIKCPTLVIRAEKSKVLSREIAEQMVERLPKGRFIEIPDAGHQVPLHQPDAFSAVVREFLAE